MNRVRVITPLIVYTLATAGLGWATGRWSEVIYFLTGRAVRERLPLYTRRKRNRNDNQTATAFSVLAGEIAREQRGRVFA